MCILFSIYSVMTPNPIEESNPLTWDTEFTHKFSVIDIKIKKKYPLEDRLLQVHVQFL